MARLLAVILGSLSLSLTLPWGVLAQEQLESPPRERWHLSWHMVDRGLVSWGRQARFTAWQDCLAAEQVAVQRKTRELQSLGDDVSEHGSLIFRRRRDDQTVLTVVHFACVEEKDWIILVAQQSQRGAVVEDRLGPFAAEEQCLDALELEVAFKTRALQKLRNNVSAVRSTTTNWTLEALGAFGTEAGQLKSITTYRCVPT